MRELFVNLKGEPRAGDLADFWPPFLDRVFSMMGRCVQRGAVYFPARGTATFEFQGELNRLFLAGKGGRAAPAGLSIHNYGGGIDFTADADNRAANGLQPTWSPKAYRILIEEAARVELLSGESFNDMPHVQIPRYVNARDLAPLRALYNRTEGADREKLQAVWAFLELPENSPFKLSPSRIA